MKKKPFIPIALAWLLLLIGDPMIAISQTSKPNDPSGIRAKYDLVRNQFDIARYQWYDLYEKGVMVKAGEAGKLIDQAKALIDQGKQADAEKLLDQANELLQVYDKSVLPVYNASNTIRNPDLSKIRNSTIDDYKARDYYGLLKGDIAIGFVGKGSDGNVYEIMPLINYHGTGGVIEPVAFEIMRSDEFENLHMVIIKKKPLIMLETDSSMVFYAEDNGNYQLYSVSKIKGKTVVWIEGAGKDLEGVDVYFNVLMQANMTYWYNQNLPDNVLYPGTSFSGIEEIGEAEGTITIGGKTATFKHAMGESENLFNGPNPELTTNTIGYRKQMTTFGNEWWMPFHTDQIDGQMCIIGASRDFAIQYQGKYIVPTEVTITPLVANKSFKVFARTSAGDLDMTVQVQTMELFYYECGCTVTGTFNGIPLTNGYSSLEKTPIGGMDGVATIDAMGKGLVKTSDVMARLKAAYPPPLLGSDKIGPEK
jgi:hypothetical protein